MIGIGIPISAVFGSDAELGSPPRKGFFVYNIAGPHTTKGGFISHVNNTEARD